MLLQRIKHHVKDKKNSIQHDARQRSPAVTVVKEDNNSNNNNNNR